MIEFTVNDMTCGHCASMITRAVKEADGSARCEIDLATKRVRIDSAKDAELFREAIGEAGYSPVRS